MLSPRLATTPQAYVRTYLPSKEFKIAIAKLRRGGHCSCVVKFLKLKQRQEIRERTMQRTAIVYHSKDAGRRRRALQTCAPQCLSENIGLSAAWGMLSAEITYMDYTGQGNTPRSNVLHPPSDVLLTGGTRIVRATSTKQIVLYNRLHRVKQHCDSEDRIRKVKFTEPWMVLCPMGGTYHLQALREPMLFSQATNER